MKLDVKIETLKFCFALLNSVFLVLGLSVMGCGIWILFDTGSFLNVLPSEELQVVAVGLFVIGGVVALVSLTGCTGAALQKRFLLLAYFCFLIALVLGQLYVIILLLLNRNRIEDVLTQTVNAIILRYGNSSRIDRIMDNVQHFTNCCGINEPEDWLQNSFIQSLNLTGQNVLPCSCFRSFQPSKNSSWCLETNSTNVTMPGTGTGFFKESCRQKIDQWLQENVITMVAMTAFLILIQVIDLFVAGSLFRMFGEKDKNKQLIDEDDTDSASEADPDGGEQNRAFMDPDEGAAEPDYMTAGDANNMADQYNQNQNQGYIHAGDANNMTYDQYQYNQDQNQSFQVQNQGFQVQNQGFQNQGFQNQSFQNQSFQNQGFQVQNQGFQNQGFQNQSFQNQGFQNQSFQNQGFQNQSFQNQSFQNQSFQNQSFQNQSFQNQSFQNQSFQEPLNFNQNQGYHDYQEANQHY